MANAVIISFALWIIAASIYSLYKSLMRFNDSWDRATTAVNGLVELKQEIEELQKDILLRAGLEQEVFDV